jgi:hypothetical protein
MGLASGEYGDELLDSPTAGLGALGRGYAVKARLEEQRARYCELLHYLHDH